MMAMMRQWPQARCVWGPKNVFFLDEISTGLDSSTTYPHCQGHPQHGPHGPGNAWPRFVASTQTHTADSMFDVHNRICCMCSGDCLLGILHASLRQEVREREGLGISWSEPSPVHRPPASWRCYNPRPEVFDIFDDVLLLCDGATPLHDLPSAA